MGFGNHTLKHLASGCMYYIVSYYPLDQFGLVVMDRAVHFEIAKTAERTDSTWGCVLNDWRGICRVRTTKFASGNDPGRI